MDFSMVNWDTLIVRSVELLLNGLWCMSVLNLTLNVKTTKLKALLKWLVILGGIIAFYAAANIGMSFLTYTLANMGEQFLSRHFLLVLGVTAFYFLYNMLAMLLPILISFFGGMAVYKESFNIKAFASVFIGLCVFITYNYVYHLACIPFMETIEGTSDRALQSHWVGYLILALSLGAAYIIYRKKVCVTLKKLIETPDGRLDRFVKIPIISCLALALMISAMYTYGISPFTTNFQFILVYTAVFGCLVLAYGMLYWTIFRGISLSAQTMKNKAELDVANQLQASILPRSFPAFPDRKEFDVFASMKAAKEIGGDFYDFFFVDRDHFAVVIADVSGKGIPAALFMMSARTLIKNAAGTGKSSENTFIEANHRLCENNETGMFVTAWLGVVELSTGTLSFVNAGHNPPLLKQQGKEYIYLDHKTYKRSIMLGLRDNIQYKTNIIQLSPGDTLFLYTDGITEANDVNQSLYGEARLKSVLDHCSETDPVEILGRVEEQVGAFVQDAEQFDDMTMLGFRLNALSQTLETEVTPEQTEVVSDFVEHFFRTKGFEDKIIYRLLIVTDEIFSNIVKYSHAGKAAIRCAINKNEMILVFEDDGVPFNPLDNLENEPEKRDPRRIGGNGLIIIKKTMDFMAYAYQNDKNVLTISKTIEKITTTDLKT